MTPQEFIKLLSDKIDKIKDFPVLKSLAIAQSCLESRYGEKSFYGNIFGIKCHDPNLYAGCRLGKTAEFVNGNYKNLSQFRAANKIKIGATRILDKWKYLGLIAGYTYQKQRITLI